MTHGRSTETEVVAFDKNTIMRVTVTGKFDGFSIMGVNSLISSSGFELLDIRDVNPRKIVFTTRFRGQSEFDDLVRQLRSLQGGRKNVVPQATLEARV